MKIKIKEAAKKYKNWSLFKLANELNLTHQTIYGWAKGRTQPSFENMDKLCRILDCKIEDLFEAENI